MKKWLEESLVCPRDKQTLEKQDNRLVCPNGHSYPVIDGIPIMLVDEETPTHDYITDSLREAGKIEAGEHLGEFLDSTRKRTPRTRSTQRPATIRRSGFNKKVRTECREWLGIPVIKARRFHWHGGH